MLFSVPYNGSDPDEYLNLLEQYKDKIHDIFLEIPGFKSHLSRDIMHPIGLRNSRNVQSLNSKQFTENTFKLLEILKNGDYKVYITFNQAFIAENEDQIREKIIELRQIVYKYKIYGIIASEFNVIKLIHTLIPEVEICSSCNSFYYNCRTYEILKENGVTLFNPPRDLSRNLNFLKKMRKYPLKILVNEGCLFGCPYSISHPISCSTGIKKEINCSLGDLSNIFRTNVILPRWLPKLERYVKVFKLTGRVFSNEKLNAVLDAYCNLRDDVLLEDISGAGVIHQLFKINKNRKNPILLYTYDIPDKVLSCQCLECNKTCFICSEKFRELLNEEIH